jgi:streptogramin lyase
MNSASPAPWWKSFRRNGGRCLLILGIFCAPSLAQAAGLFVSFYSADTVAYYDTESGLPINSNFASVQSPIGLVVGPDRNLYVGSDNLDSSIGAGVVSFGINGTNSAPLGIFASHVDNNALNNPQGLAFSHGNLYIADVTSSTIFVYNNLSPHTGTLSNTLSSINPAIVQPEGLNSDTNGTVYVANEGLGSILSYAGGSFAQVNGPSVLYNAPHSVALGPDGYLYVLDTSATGGVDRLNPTNGASDKIVDYSIVDFQAYDLAIGLDGKIYVSGQDLDTAEGEILQYNLDGSGGHVAIDAGFGTSPGFMAFAPSPLVAPTILGRSALGNHSFQLTFTGPAGQPYTVIATTNLTLPTPSWTKLTNAVFGAGPAIYTDLAATNLSRRFYRVVSP